MSVTVENLEGSKAKLNITVDAETFGKARDAAFKKNKNKISMPGFRKGKVPRKMIERMYGKGAFDDDAVNIAAPDAYKEALDEVDLEIISNPRYDLVDITDDGEFTFSATIAVKPEVKLGEYIGLEVAAHKVTILDSDIDAELDRVREQNARMIEVTDRAVKDDDKVTIDFEGFVDGKAFDGGKGEDYDLLIGSHSFIDDFEEQLIGKNIGDDVDVNVTFPEEYHEESLAGKPALFKVKIKGITEKELPDLDDDFAEEVSEFDTLDEYKEDIRKSLTERREAAAKDAREAEAVEKLVSLSTMEIADEAIEDQCEEMAQEFAYRIQMQGLSPQQYMQMTGMTPQSLIAQMQPEAEKRLQARFVLEAVVKAEGMEPDEEKVEEEIKRYADMMGKSVEDYKKEMSDRDMKNLRMDVAVKDAAAFIAEKADVYWKADEDVENSDDTEDKEED